MWPDDEGFQKCKALCEYLMVINGPAERTVECVEDTAQMTCDPDQRAATNVVHSYHRGSVP